MNIFRSKLIWLIVLIAVLSLLIFFNYLKLRIDFQNVVYQIYAPFLNFFHSLGQKLYNFYKFVFFIKSIIQENVKLKEQNQALLVENVLFQETLEENELLRRALKIPLASQKKIILAEIIGYDPQNLEQYILINKGQNDGLKNDAVVINETGILVGRVMETHPHFAKVLLVISPQSAINVFIRQDNGLEKIQGLIKGKHSLKLIMEMIPLEEQASAGQLVVTSGLGGIFPRGLLIGEVERIIFSATDVFKQALIRPLIDFRKLEKVFIIID